MLMLIMLLSIGISYAWWNDNWQYRKEIIIQSSKSVADHQVLLNISIDKTKIRSDFKDLRLVDASDNELYFVIETSCGNNTFMYDVTSDNDNYYIPVWVKTTLTQGNNTVYAYYGANVNDFDSYSGYECDESKSSNVFSFITTLNAFNKIQLRTDGSGNIPCSYAQIEDGIAHFICYDTQGYWIDVPSYQPKTITEYQPFVEGRVKSITNGKNGNAVFGIQLRNETKPGGSPSWAEIGYGENNWSGATQVNFATCYDHYTQCNSGPNVNYDISRWHFYGFGGNSSYAYFYTEPNNVGYSSTSYLPSPSLSLKLMLNTACSTNNNSTGYYCPSELYLDWVRVRQYSDASLVYMLLLEEQNPTITTTTVATTTTPVTTTTVATTTTHVTTTTVKPKAEQVILNSTVPLLLSLGVLTFISSIAFQDISLNREGLIKIIFIIASIIIVLAIFMIGF